MLISFAPSFGALPTWVFADEDAEWARLLGSPEEGPKEGSCIRTVTFHDGAHAPTQLNVHLVWGALFDIDGDRIPTFDMIGQALEGHRFIAFNTWNSEATRAHLGLDERCRPHGAVRCPSCRVGPRLRLVVPYSRPIQPWEHAYVWRSINAMLENVAHPGQANVDRLGYLARIRPGDPEARARYAWTIRGGQNRLDPYTRFGNGAGFPQELLTMPSATYQAASHLPEPDRTDWYSDVEAYELARTYFRSVGPGITPGGRHAELFKIGCRLWWDFCLPHDSVRTILHEVNRRFPEPKADHQVDAEVESSFARTWGHSAVVQADQYGVPKEAGCMRKRPPRLSYDDVLGLASQEKRSHDLLRREIGEALLRVVPDRTGNYRPLGNVETRDRLLRLSARFLGEKFPDHEPSSIVNIFIGTVAAAHAQDPWPVTAEMVQAHVAQGQNDMRKEVLRKQEAARTELAARIREATHGARETVYTNEEIFKFADDNGATYEEWKRRWVIVTGTSHHIFVDGTYRAPIPRDYFVPRAIIDLSPVDGINLHKQSNKEIVPLSAQEIVMKYGTVARHTRAVLSAQRSYYDAAEECFIYAPCPLRPIKPERVPVVETWLQLFNNPTLLQWLAWVPILDEPLPGIYLHGPKSSGKTLLVEGLSRLFGFTGSTPMDEMFSSFNESTARNPILFADEHLPERLQRRGGNEVFRRSVIERRRPLHRKHQANTDVEGCFRYALAANNAEMLPKGTGMMTRDDTLAVAERVLYVPLSGEPFHYLQSLPRRTRQSFINDDLIAKHVLWLRDHRSLTTENRFVVSGVISDPVREEAYSGLNGVVLGWLYRMMLVQEGPTGALANVPLVHRDGRWYFGLNAHIIYDRWRTAYGMDAKDPDENLIRRSVRAMCAKKARFRFGDTNLRWSLLDVEMFAEWGHTSDIDPTKTDQFIAKCRRESLFVRGDEVVVVDAGRSAFGDAATT